MAGGRPPGRPRRRLGCKPAPEVTRYTAPHERADSGPDPDPPEDPAAGDRILGLIAAAPGDQQPQWWFFKLRGRPQAVGRRVAGLEACLATLRFPKADGQLPTFELPAGWELGRPSNQFALFTIRTGHSYSPHNLDVSKTGGSLADNVNRWRRQVGLAELPEADVAKSLRDVTAADGTKVYWVDLAGPGGDGRPPFAKP